MAKTTKTSKISDTLIMENLTYEEALTELEGIVESLEGEQNLLEDSMKLFERGQALNGGRLWSCIAAHCSMRLNSKCRNWSGNQSSLSRKNQNEPACNFTK